MFKNYVRFNFQHKCLHGKTAGIRCDVVGWQISAKGERGTSTGR